MKQNTHPNNYNATVTCVCGNTFQALSTQQAIQVDICAACHPFFTNEQRFLDRKGRVDRFRKQQERAQANVGQASAGKKTKQATETLSFQEILEAQKKSVQTVQEAA